MSEDEDYVSRVYNSSEKLKISGIVIAKDGVNSRTLQPGIAYTSDLINHIIDKSTSSELVKKQLKNKDIDVFSNTSFDEKKEKYRPVFASFVSLMTIWDFHSYLTDSTFILSRTWQGKSMFVALGIPLVIMILLMLGECEGKKNIFYVFLIFLSFACVAMTPASIYLYSIMLFVGSFCVAVAVKKMSLFFKVLPTLLPMAGFALLYYFYFS